MKLLVRNLPRHITQAQLHEMFEAYGAVQSCNLVMDAKSGLSKGFGFVEMPKPGHGKAAMKILNGKVFGEHKIRVKKAEETSETAPAADAKPSEAEATPAATPARAPRATSARTKTSAPASKSPRAPRPAAAAKPARASTPDSASISPWATKASPKPRSEDSPYKRRK